MSEEETMRALGAKHRDLFGMTVMRTINAAAADDPALRKFRCAIAVWEDGDTDASGGVWPAPDVPTETAIAMLESLIRKMRDRPADVGG